ncbi:NADH-quinone oxidoreductase subunit C [Parasporobacterium paucivorans]|uniref:Ech hydrogenase subunit D n=1 Tax=Parasporobacterium paucivorans DSM 15970 TaxID=1122934 RepID=A0A1M6KXW9_9FIRM|nr:NADH-quinone oxidoreductase subunit C [Parasporobacterium paucivorans]SHJ63770.1 ech hydrogenase subunit D [Parasporobacterium paucivorans DSM 15970]
MEQQTLRMISPEDLLSETLNLKNSGYRFVAISCTKVGEGLEISYSFEKNQDFVSLRIVVEDNAEIESVSCFYVPAFLYENEIKELFGIKVKNILLDYNDNFYKIAKKTPFNEKKEAL